MMCSTSSARWITISCSDTCEGLVFKSALVKMKQHEAAMPVRSESRRKIPATYSGRSSWVLRRVCRRRWTLKNPSCSAQTLSLTLIGLSALPMFCRMFCPERVVFVWMRLLESMRSCDCSVLNFHLTKIRRVWSLLHGARSWKFSRWT